MVHKVLAVSLEIRCVAWALLLARLSSIAVGQCQPLWSDAFPSGDLHGAAYAFALFDDNLSAPSPNLVFAAGGFTTAGRWPATGIARWNGQDWSSVAGGLGGAGNATQGRCLVVFDDDGRGPRLPALYVGGVFATAGGIHAPGIARWDGAAWGGVGGGVGIGGPDSWTGVYAMSVFDDGTGEALYAGGTFQTAGGTPIAALAKWDGHAWSRVGEGLEYPGSLPLVSALSVIDPDGTGPVHPELYVGGTFMTAGGLPASNVASWNGQRWSAMGSGVAFTWFDAQVYAIAAFNPDPTSPGPTPIYVGGRFTSAGGANANNIARWDGSAWSGLPYHSLEDHWTHALGVFDDGSGPALFLGGPDLGLFIVNKWTGSAWMPPAGWPNNQATAICALDLDGSGPEPAKLFLGGTFGPGASVWNGASAAVLKGPGLGVDDEINCIVPVAVSASGAAVAGFTVGGWFTRAAEVPASHIASHDAQGWHSLGEGLNASVTALAMYDEDGPGPNLSRLFAAGDFTASGTVNCSRVARWDGVAWTPVGSGFGWFSRALLVWDPDGDGPLPTSLFTASRLPDQTTQGTKVLRWDGNSWTVFAGPPATYDNYLIDALAVFDEDGDGPMPPALFAAGSFVLPNGECGIAKWDGSSWVGVGGGLNANTEGFALATFDDDGPGPHRECLYLGGRFSSAGSMQAPGIVRWDGTAWSSVGGVVGQGIVYSLAPHDPDGVGPSLPRLYAGGSFFWNPGQVGSVASWDGVSWSRLGVEGAFWPNAMTSARDELGNPMLVMGGVFDSAGGNSSEHIAIWGCPTPQYCYANCDHSAIAPILNANDFACFLNRFAAGDEYTNCDGSSVPPILNINDFQCFLNRFAAGCQ